MVVLVIVVRDGAEGSARVEGQEGVEEVRGGGGGPDHRQMEGGRDGGQSQRQAATAVGGSRVNQYRWPTYLPGDVAVVFVVGEDGEGGGGGGGRVRVGGGTG